LGFFIDYKIKFMAIFHLEDNTGQRSANIIKQLTTNKFKFGRKKTEKSCQTE